MEAFDSDALTSEKVTVVEQLLNSDAFTLSKIKQENETAAILLQWVTSLIAFYKSKTALSVKTPVESVKTNFDEVSSVINLQSNQSP